MAPPTVPTPAGEAPRPPGDHGRLAVGPAPVKRGVAPPDEHSATAPFGGVTPAHPTVAGGRAFAWAGFLFGSVMSIAANVLYTWFPKPPAGAPEGWAPAADWAPSLAAQIGAAVWPIGLLISVEVLSRVPWPAGWLWKVARYGGAGTVALGSAVISYGHLNHVLTVWGYDAIGATVGPLVLDGLMVVSGFALLALGHPDQTAEEPARAARPDAETATPVQVDREPVRTAEPVQADRTTDHQVAPARTTRARTDGPDPLEPEVLDWARSEPADRTITGRAIRDRFRVGPGRAKRLLEAVDADRARRSTIRAVGQ